jgi:DNA recombination protein RmuC
MDLLIAALIGGALLLGLLAIAGAVVVTARTRGTAAQPELHAAIDAVVELANDKLGATVESSRHELDHRTQVFDRNVADVRRELGRLDELVGQLKTESGQQHSSLVESLRQVSRANQELTDHTQALREALASPKQRGQWGERMADDVLAAAGLVEGVNFRRQRAIEGGTIPDFRFLLPRDLELRMDVKFPVDNYLRVLEAERDDDVATHTKAFVRDVRNRVRELAGRGYVDPRDTVDCMLLFIPNEAVYAFLHEADPGIIDLALGEKVVLCSPATLFAVLAVVRQSVEQFRLERTSDEILRCLGSVNDEWGKFTESLDKLGKQLATVTRTFEEEVDGTRRRVFEKKLGEIDRLRNASIDPGAGEQLVARKAAGDVRQLDVPADDRDEAV